MTDSQPAKSYPMISEKYWWALRDRFKSSLPKGNVTGSYLATVLNSDGGSMSERSARNNVLNHLRRMGMVDEDGKLDQELAGLWRSDDGYSAACQQILEDVYPMELLDALPPPTPDLESTKNWFMRATGNGEQAARRMATTYRLLAEADVTRQSSLGAEIRTKKSTEKVKPTKKSASSDSALTAETEATTEEKISSGTSFQPIDPAIHVNVQVHISAESSAEQIESIFASMKKYLLPGNGMND